MTKFPSTKADSQNISKKAKKEAEWESHKKFLETIIKKTKSNSGAFPNLKTLKC